MSKAILVIDMPKKCGNCSCYNSGNLEFSCCQAYEVKDIDDPRSVPSWCPLKPMPEKELIVNGCPMSDDYRKGWNDCIDAILGAEE